MPASRASAQPYFPAHSAPQIGLGLFFSPHSLLAAAHCSGLRPSTSSSYIQIAYLANPRERRFPNRDAKVKGTREAGKEWKKAASRRLLLFLRPPLLCRLPDSRSPTPTATTCGCEAVSFSVSPRPDPDLVDDQIAASHSPSHPGRHLSSPSLPSRH
ncbi:unnamed protein product [Linum trigynum]|uniref:Uncharacterized protein n=1 Tax=Linum trigynum TaxID=586398 RepID=A0AAV2DH78_9ROSI